VGLALIKRFCWLLSRLLLLTTLGLSVQTHEAEARTGQKPDLQSMIGQMLIVGFAGSTPQNGDIDSLTWQISNGVIGGVMLLKRNVKSPKQLATLTQYLQDAAVGLPLFIAVDQEGGSVQRLTSGSGFADWQSAAEVARLTERDPAYAFAYYAARAKDLHDLHINLNFGPVVDVNVNPSSPVIGALGRSFSADPAEVALDGGDFVLGHRANGVLTAIKHFPGHGSATSDSHKSLPDISGTWSAKELVPYQELASKNLVDMAMMGHLILPKFSDGTDVPTSLSVKAVSALRSIVGNKTVIITDDLQMHPIQQRFTESEAVIMAILAGNDVLLLSTYDHIDPDIGLRINLAIQKAVESGRIPKSRIESAYARIVALKSRIGG